MDDGILPQERMTQRHACGVARELVAQTDWQRSRQPRATPLKRRGDGQRQRRRIEGLARRQIVQQHGVDRIARSWRHGIPKSDAHLSHAARVGKLAVQRHAHATVARIRADHLDPDRSAVEDDAVVSGHGCDA